jgi:hypothetical protein
MRITARLLNDRPRIIMPPAITKLRSSPDPVHELLLRHRAASQPRLQTPMTTGRRTRQRSNNILRPYGQIHPRIDSGRGRRENRQRQRNPQPRTANDNPAATRNHGFTGS